MIEPGPFPDATDATASLADLPAHPGAPRWVKVFGIIALAAILLVVAMMLTGAGGGHGPGRHVPAAGGSGGQTPLSTNVQPSEAGGHTPPVQHP